jgi:AAHS family 3-hydroxyphenylpropionic acid transporter
MVIFGVFSIATALAESGQFLVEIRFFTGLGLGAALANIIALVAETGRDENKARRVTVITATHPLGGAIPGAIMSMWPELDWRAIFHIGGWWPLVLAVVMLLKLSESPAFRQRSEQTTAGASHSTARPIPALEALFGGRRTKATLMLWVSFFFCVLAIHLIINWLPTLLVSQGYSPRDATAAALAFPLGGALGTVFLGVLMGSVSRSRVIAAAFGGILIAVGALAIAPHSLIFMLTAAFATGFFVIGTQFVLYGISPTYYPAPARGTGVGTAVAVARLGSITGPVMAGLLIGAGQPPSHVLMSILPGVFLAFLAAMTLSRIPATDGD